ncbi:MAG: DUF11 domain-containing protein [Methanobacteriaceae archaeon]|nr:DUF11 domain-containing protein [Methanobacteriaceae archaeon]
MKTRNIQGIVLLLGLLLLLFATVSTVTAANTIYVNNATGNDDNDGLTPATAKATIQNGTNTVDDGGTVFVADGTYPEHIIIDKNVNLIGQSQTGTIIDGTNNGRPLTIQWGTTVNLNKLTIQNGRATGNIGGGVYNQGNLNMTQCTVSGNTANRGGGIYNRGNLNMTQCTVSGNTAIYDGGGIYNTGKLNMSQCTVSGNTAAATGAGVFDSGTSTMYQCTISENSGVSQGAGVYINIYSMPSMYQCTFSRNTAVNEGGGVYNYYAKPSMYQCTFNGNTAVNDGGGVYNYYGTLIIDTSTFISNNAGANGGAIFNHHGTSIINQSPFLSNTASSGGAIYNFYVTFTANFCRISGNTASSGSGNAVYANDGTNNLEKNWWGLNQPTFSVLLYGVSDPTVWLYMTIDAAPNPINNGATSLVTVSFNNFFDGTTVTPFNPAVGHIPDLTPVRFQTDKGSIGSKIIDKTTLNGVATATLTADETAGVAKVNGTTDSQTVSKDVTINPKSSLYLTVTPSKTNPVAGEVVTYTLKVGNNGPDAAENVVMTYTLPDGMEFAGASDDIGNQWTYDRDTRTLTWNLRTVPVGDPTLILNLRFLRAGDFLINPQLSTTTYDPTLNEETQSLSMDVQAAPLVVQAGSSVRSKTVGMQSTGISPVGVILAIFMVLGGLISAHKKI